MPIATNGVIMPNHETLGTQAGNKEIEAAAHMTGVEANMALGAFAIESITSVDLSFGATPEPKVNYDNPEIMRASVRNGRLVVPAAWRDEGE